MPAKGKCPLCGQPTDPEFTPFCSRACRDKDLLAWLGEDYRMPVRSSEEGDDEAGSALRHEDGE
jgi:endogenous inhibitor of DNA gyrase (YacG/DUF329 family)